MHYPLRYFCIVKPKDHANNPYYFLLQFIASKFNHRQRSLHGNLEQAKYTPDSFTPTKKPQRMLRLLLYMLFSLLRFPFLFSIILVNSV